MGAYIDEVTRGTTQHCYMRGNDDKTWPAGRAEGEMNHAPRNVRDEGQVTRVRGRGGREVHVDGGGKGINYDIH